MFRIGKNEDEDLCLRPGIILLGCIFRSFFQSTFDQKKFYPSKTGIALTLDEWQDLKTLIHQVDEVISCSKIIMEDDCETFERLNKSCMTQTRESYWTIMDSLGSNLTSVIKEKALQAAIRWENVKRLDNHIARSHKGVTRAMNDRQPPRHFASHNKGVICQFPNCHKEVLQLDKHVKNMHVMKMREYYQYLKFGNRGRAKRSWGRWR
ncbi:hypothetical protein OS493_020778 [Desmophyllum pertusum]|uniref:Uncharacterized protein n=1 Tax=Desmophyllum pertusum TaxID=174260 RepID=A0A9W9YMV6_9CNID|nr:hypothetical protein OS493_020778 [Desmophyllum pertusum]